MQRTSVPAGALGEDEALPAAPPATGSGGNSSDLLMRFFESEWFDAWIALTCVGGGGAAAGAPGCPAARAAPAAAARALEA